MQHELGVAVEEIAASWVLPMRPLNKKKYSVLGHSELRRLKQLEEMNAKLKLAG